MKARCKRKELLAAFGMVSGVVPTRSPKPILQNVKMVADPDVGTTLMATDLEVGIRHKVYGVTAYEPGSVILPTDKMQSILAKLADAEIDIETEGDHLIVRGLYANFRLPSEDPGLFPEVPDFTASSYHVVAAADLRKLIRRTIFATDVESTRYALGGVLIELTGDAVTMVGTDGRRLAKMSAPAEAEADAQPPAGSPVIPVKALKLIDRNLDDPELSVHVAFQAGSSVLIRTSDQGAIIYSRLVEGRFPRYQDVFPADVEVKIPLDVAQLRQAVDQASIVTSDESRGVDFEFDGDTLTLSSQAADVGSSKVTMPIHHDGKKVEITFDPRYLSDALKTIDDDATITAELIDHKNAAVFKTEDRYSYVVMPLTRDR
jgi:DNA polymerase III subunit beta